MTTTLNYMPEKPAVNPAPDPTMQPESKKKPWFVKYRTTLGLLVCWFFVLILPWIVDMLNGIPKPDELKTIEVRVLRIYEKEPHLRVQLPDGSEQYMEFPVSIGMKGGYLFHELSADEKARLPGCRAVVRGVPLKWTLTDRFRVWELICLEKNIYLNFDRSVKYFKNIEHGTGVKVITGIGNFAVFVFFFVVFLREKRGTL